MARPPLNPEDRKTRALYARAPDDVLDAWVRYCHDVHHAAPSEVLRRLVVETLKTAGFLKVFREVEKK